MSALLANATFRLHIYGTQAAHLPTNCLLSIPKVTVKCRLCQTFFHLFACSDPLQCFQLFQILTHSQKETWKNNNIKPHQTTTSCLLPQPPPSDTCREGKCLYRLVTDATSPGEFLGTQNWTRAAGGSAIPLVLRLLKWLMKQGHAHKEIIMNKMESSTKVPTNQK